MKHRRKTAALLMSCACLTGGCSAGSDPDYEAEATLGVKQYVSGQLQMLSRAAEAIERAAPEPDEDGWNAQDDAEAVDELRAAWRDARAAYERVEGSIAILFDGLDVSTDERYDGFIEEAPDDNLFDDDGVVGVHAIERILWSDQIPARVVKFESTLPGYKPAAFPANRDEADDFKNKLCARLTRETRQMRDDFAPLALDSTTAFRGMIGSMQEQSEKTTKAASGEDESRYAQHTLADMRANLAGARAVFAAFRPWIDDTTGPAVSRDFAAEFADIERAYDAVDGVALPAVPSTFNPDNPSAEDLDSAYGKLWQLLNAKTDPEDADSFVSKMGRTATDMGIEGIEAE